MREAFKTTHWSLVLAAGDLEDSRSRQALSELFEAYWYPLYAFARRRGADADDAADLVQGFFARLLETTGLGAARQDLGRFRSYLLGAFKHYVGHQEERAAAQKRGGGTAPISLDAADADRRYRDEPADERTPERVFERRWALTVVDRALRDLRREYRRAGKAELFDELKSQLTGGAERGSLRRAAAKLGLKEGTARVAAHRLRRRFAALLKTEVAATVDSPEAVDEELRYLLSALGR